MLAWILDYTGLAKKFHHSSGECVNAAAVIRDRQRYILYNQTWMAAIDREGNTDWEAVNILAHEIGHHLNGHTLVMKAAVPQRRLRADIFSGYVLAQMGASLEESQEMR
ncbi:MAG: M48 family metalloprotease [Deinococcales bacterium]